MGTEPRRTVKATILLIEDNEEVRNILALFLRRSGYIVEETEDGVSGLEAATNSPPDLILLDVLLPKLDGIEVLKRLRSTERGQAIPVIMMSAVLQMRDLKAETARLNVASIIQKPFQMRSILKHVEQALSPSDKSDISSANRTSAINTENRQEKRLIMRRLPLAESGKLEVTPIPEILHSIFVASRTGQLSILSGTTEKRVFFQNGIPVYAESSIPEETLGAHLVQRGKISSEQHANALAEMTTSGRHFGEALLRLSFLGPHELFTELESHLTAKVISTFGWFEGSFTFEDGDRWKDDVIVARMKPGRIMFDGVLRYWNPQHVQRRLRITDESKTFPIESSPYTDDHLALSTQESRIRQMVRRGLTVGELIRQEGDVQLVTTILYALFIMEHVGFTVPVRSDSSIPPSQAQISSTPSSPLPTKEELAKILLAEYLKYRTADYFQLLGVSRDANKDQLTRAFRERQTRYHPDALIGIDNSLVQERVEELYIRLHNAYRTLMDPVQRQQYIASIDDKMAAQTPMAARSLTGRIPCYQQKSADAVLFEEGFALLRSGHFREALDRFKAALEITPKPRYEAYRAWAAYLADPVAEGQSTDQSLSKLQKENPEEALYPYLLGSLALRERNLKRAIMCFERTVELDHQHIDAARQLRLLKMRQRQQAEASGLLDFFKKKGD